MKVFLTGATGFIGIPLTKELLAKGWQVTALVRNPNGAQAKFLTRMGAKCVQGDVTDRESMRAPMQAADTVIHNAGHYEVGIDAAGAKRMLAINVTGTENVLGLAFELGIARTLYVSSVMAFGESGPEIKDETYQRSHAYRTFYERTKTEAHTIALEYQRRGLPLVIACPNGVIGPNDHSVWGYFQRLYINNLMPPMAPSRHTILALVEVGDLAQGLVLAAEKGLPGETYIFSGEPKTLEQHVTHWTQKPGGYRPKIWLPAGLAKFMFWWAEPLQRMAGLPAFMSVEMVTQANTNINYSSAKARRELGWAHRSAEDMWLMTLEGEIDLLRKRQKRDLVSLLKPLETVD